MVQIGEISTEKGAQKGVDHARNGQPLTLTRCVRDEVAEAEDMCIDPASVATITRVLAYSARTFPLDCEVYLERFSLCYSRYLRLRRHDCRDAR